MLFAAASFAGSSDNVSGWAWSENIGWISFNCANTNSCGTVNYGVTINPGNGKFSGYAWSDNVGWLSFTPKDLSGCPSTPCETRLDFSANKVTGWAKFLAGSPAAAGWDGWVHLSGTASGGSPYGVTRSGSQLIGWAWGGDVVGWMKFGGSTFTTELGSQVSQGGTVTVEATNPDNTRYFGPLSVQIDGPTTFTTVEAPSTVGVASGKYTLTYLSGGPSGSVVTNSGLSSNINQGDNLSLTFIFTNPPAPPFGASGPPTASKIASDDSFFCPSTQVIFSWLYSDPNGDPQGAFELEADDNSLFTSPELASGVVVSSDKFYINDPGKLFFNTTYYWRARVRDSKGAWSDWSLTNSFITPTDCIVADFSLISSNDIFVNIAREKNVEESVVAPAAHAQQKERSSSTTLTIVPTKFTSQVSFTIDSGFPSGASAFFNPQKINSSAYDIGSEFYVEVPRDVAEGIYTITIKADGGGLVRTANVLLSVIITDPRFKEF